MAEIRVENVKCADKFFQIQQSCTLDKKITACIFTKNFKIIHQPSNNTERNSIRGYYCGSHHAECRCISQFFGKDLQYDSATKTWRLNRHRNVHQKKWNILVMRYLCDGTTGNARPCFNCVKMMRDVGIYKVYYTTGYNNTILGEKVVDMVSIQTSSVIFKILNKNKNETKNDYFENLLKIQMPKTIKENNLFYFLEYNFRNVLPMNTYQIHHNQRIDFYDKTGETVIASSIIY
jgi:deoxycytidylate deaminase